MSAEDKPITWDYVAGEAKAGRLRVDQETARIYSDACQKLADRLYELQQQVQKAGNITGLGGFVCAGELEKGLTDLFIGPNGSIASTISQYIDVAKKIHETVGYSLTKLADQDQAGAPRITAAVQGD